MNYSYFRLQEDADNEQHSQSQQILWLLEELSLAYPEFKYKVNFFKREAQRAPAALKETHPLGKSPQLLLPSGRVIIERSAIALYLINTFDTAGKFKLNPSDADNDVIREEELLSFAGTSVNPIMTTQFVFDQLRIKSPFFMKPLTGGIGTLVNKGFLTKEMENMTKYLNDQLVGREWLMGGTEPTRADFCIQWYVDMGSQLGKMDMNKHQNLNAWLTRCKNRPAWKTALEKGNGYDMKTLLSS